MIGCRIVSLKTRGVCFRCHFRLLCVCSCCKQPILLGDSLFKASNCPVGQNKCNPVAWKICSFSVLPLELRTCSLLLQYSQLRKCLQLPSLYRHVSKIFCPSVLATLSPLALRCREVESCLIHASRATLRTAGLTVRLKRLLSFRVAVGNSVRMSFCLHTDVTAG